MSFSDVLKNVWGLKWIFRLCFWLKKEAIEGLKRSIQDDISAADKLATIVHIHPDFLTWSCRIAKARADLERDGAEAQQYYFYGLNIPPLDSTYLEIKAPSSIEENLVRLHSLGDFGRSASKAMILSGNILAAEPNSPAEVECQMDLLRKLDGLLQSGLEQLDQLRDKQLAEQR